MVSGGGSGGPRTERLLRVVSAGAGLTIATSMTNSHSTDTSRSLWKQNKLNNKGERWHSPPFSQLHQINCPSHLWARGRCWSPRLEAQRCSDESFSIPGFPPQPWLLLGSGHEAGKVPSSAGLKWPSHSACITYTINNGKIYRRYLQKI